jgi:hypothetical protein
MFDVCKFCLVVHQRAQKGSPTICKQCIDSWLPIALDDRTSRSLFFLLALVDALFLACLLSWYRYQPPSARVLFTFTIVICSVAASFEMAGENITPSCDNGGKHRGAVQVTASFLQTLLLRTRHSLPVFRFLFWTWMSGCICETNALEMIRSSTLILVLVLSNILLAPILVGAPPGICFVVVLVGPLLLVLRSWEMHFMDKIHLAEVHTVAKSMQVFSGSPRVWNFLRKHFIPIQPICHKNKNVIGLNFEPVVCLDGYYPGGLMHALPLVTNRDRSGQQPHIENETEHAEERLVSEESLVRLVD